MGQNRKCGVLLPISSLPSKYGIGCFDKKAYEFVDALKEAGQSYWQILPLGPTSYGDSPYQSFSTFAGNPYFISLEDLIEEGVLTKKECDKIDFGEDETSVDYAKLYEGRMFLLRKAYEKSDIYMDAEFRKFQEEEAWWLKDYALFMAVKKRFGGIPWSEWAEDIRLRWQNALDYYREEMYFEIEFQEYLQFKFRQQWMKLKAYANENGIQITDGFRADGLERILYKCPHCGTEGELTGKGTGLTCRHCGKHWELTPIGDLAASEGETEFAHVPDWYRWEREQVRRELEDGTYKLDIDVDIAMMVDFKAIYKVGQGHLTHDREGFTLTGCGGKLRYTQKPTASYGLYADYYWYEIADTICIGDNRCLYYCFPKAGYPVAKTRLAAEELYKLCKTRALAK